MNKPKTVAEMLDSPEKWSKHHMATTADGTQVRPESDEAQCFCLLGALQRCYLETERFAEKTKAVQAVVGGSVILFNDHPDTTFEMVRKVIEEAGV